MGSTTTRRDAAEHFCPAYPNADCTTAGTAWSRSASASTMSAFLPPISAMTRFTCRCPGRWTAAEAVMARPTALDPVKAMSATSGCSTSQAPITSPRPGRNPSTPGGSPPAVSASTRRAATAGVCSAGLSRTGLPVTRAAQVMPAGIASGKFQGAMTAAIPFAW